MWGGGDVAPITIALSCILSFLSDIEIYNLAVLCPLSSVLCPLSSVLCPLYRYQLTLDSLSAIVAELLQYGFVCNELTRIIYLVLHSGSESEFFKKSIVHISAIATGCI